MQDHSSSERSVGFHFLMRARVAKYPPRTTFHTVSERLSEKSWKHPSVALQTTVKALLDPFRPPHKVRIRLRSPLGPLFGQSQKGNSRKFGRSGGRHNLTVVGLQRQLLGYAAAP